MNRRSFLASILAAGVAPAVIGSGILMPVRKLIDPYAYLRDPGQWYIPWPHNTILDNDTILPPMDLSEASLEQAIADIREIQLGSAIRGVCLSFQPTRAFISPRFLRPTEEQGFFGEAILGPSTIFHRTWNDK